MSEFGMVATIKHEREEYGSITWSLKPGEPGCNTTTRVEHVISITGAQRTSRPLFLLKRISSKPGSDGRPKLMIQRNLLITEQKSSSTEMNKDIFLRRLWFSVPGTPVLYDRVESDLVIMDCSSDRMDSVTLGLPTIAFDNILHKAREVCGDIKEIKRTNGFIWVEASVDERIIPPTYDSALSEMAGYPLTYFKRFTNGQSMMTTCSLTFAYESIDETKKVLNIILIHMNMLMRIHTPSD